MRRDNYLSSVPSRIALPRPGTPLNEGLQGDVTEVRFFSTRLMYTKVSTQNDAPGRSIVTARWMIQSYPVLQSPRSLLPKDRGWNLLEDRRLPDPSMCLVVSSSLCGVPVESDQISRTYLSESLLMTDFST